ncbi:MAG: hypothetical protein Q9166_004385 [cf. Caloplaca sp. 2 TL-2023]
MGNDGGSIPTRRELVKEAAKDPNTTQVKETQTEKLRYYWSHWNLYNKDAVLESLLSTSQHGQDGNVASNDRTAGKIKTLRDIVEVHFRTEDVREEDIEPNSSEVRMVCPVTGKRLGPGVKAVYLVPCGHAFAETAVREMPGEQCLECNESYARDNVIPILPISAADKDRLRNRLSKLQSEGLAHSLKKAAGPGKKRKKFPSAKDAEAVAAPVKTAGPEVPQEEAVAGLSSNAIRNEETESLTAKVLAEQEDRSKKRRMAPNENLKALFSSSSGMAGKQSDFMTRGFSIPAGAKR